MLSLTKPSGPSWVVICVLLSLSGIKASAIESVIDWWPTPQAVTISHLKKVRFDGQFFHVAGQAGVALTSPDGVNWFNQGHFTRRPFKKMTQFRGKVYTAADNADIFSLGHIPAGADLAASSFSDNGYQLSLLDLNVELDINQISDLAANDNRIVVFAFAQGGFGSVQSHLIYSNDGVLWESSEVPKEISATTMVEVLNNEFYAFSPHTGELAKSSNGVQWRKLGAFKNGSNFVASEFKAEGNHLILTGMNGFLAYSMDGLVWRVAVDAFPEDFHLTNIKFAQGKYVTVGNEGRIFTSTNLRDWTEVTPTWSRTQWNSVSYGNGVWVTAGNHGIIGYSTDSTKWVSASPDAIRNVSSADFSDGRYILNSNDSEWMESSDLVTWKSIEADIPFEVVTSFISGDLRLAGGSAGQIAWSNADSPFVETWTPVSTRIQKIVSGNGAIVAISKNGNIIYSENGIDWEKSPVKIQSLHDISFADGTFAAVGISSNGEHEIILTSSNGIDWIEAEISQRYNLTRELTGITYGNGKWVAVGYSRGVSSKSHKAAPPIYVSSDAGVTFSSVENQWHNLQLNGVVYFDSRFHAYGEDGIIIESQDGESWNYSRATALSTQDFVDGAAGSNGIVMVTHEGNLLTTRVERINDLPIVGDDEASIPFGTRIVLNVLANDSDPDGFLVPGSVHIIASPDGGTVRVLENGQIEFTHDGLFSGRDLFTYTVTDNDGGISFEANVSLTIGEPLPTTFHNPITPIAVDGNLADWESTLPVGVDQRDLRSDDSGLDWKNIYAAHDANFLYLAYTTYKPTELNWAHNIFLDNDRDASTGLAINGLGAEFLIQQGQVFKYTGDGNSWNWLYLFTATQSFTPTSVEMAIPRLALGDPLKIRLSFFAANTANDPDGSLIDDYYPEKDEIIRYSLEGHGENRKPFGTPQTLTTFADRAIEFTLNPIDAEEQPMRLRIITSPLHGRIIPANSETNELFTGADIKQGNQPILLVYLPNEGFTGIDSFEWVVSDGSTESNVIRDEIIVYNKPEDGYPGIPVYNIQVDGNPHDWTGIPKMEIDPIDYLSFPDLRSLSIANSAHHLFVMAKTQVPAPIDYSLNVFLDTDISSDSGYRGDKDRLSIGADFLIQGVYLFQYTGTGQDWSWKWVNNLRHANDLQTHEWQVHLTDLNNPSKIHVIMKGEDKNHHENDFIPTAQETLFTRYQVSYNGLLTNNANLVALQPIDFRPRHLTTLSIFPELPKAIRSSVESVIGSPIISLDIETIPGETWNLYQSFDLNTWTSEKLIEVNSRNPIIFLPHLEKAPNAFFKAEPSIHSGPQ